MRSPTTIVNQPGSKSWLPIRNFATTNHHPPHQTSCQSPPKVWPPCDFSIEEHLRVQQEIGECAQRLWLAAEGAEKGALDFWLKAERKVLAEFVNRRRQPESELPNADKLPSASFSLSGKQLNLQPHQAEKMP